MGIIWIDGQTRNHKNFMDTKELLCDVRVTITLNKKHKDFCIRALNENHLKCFNMTSCL